MIVWLTYYAFSRRGYNRKNKTTRIKAYRFALKLLLEHILIIMFVSEALLKYNGILTFIHTHKAPWVQIAGGIFLLISSIVLIIFPIQYNAKLIHIIRDSIIRSQYFSKRFVLIILYSTDVAFFICSFVSILIVLQ